MEWSAQGRIVVTELACHQKFPGSNKLVRIYTVAFIDQKSALAAAALGDNSYG